MTHSSTLTNPSTQAVLDRLYRDADAVDLPLQRDAGALVDALPHSLAERLDVGGARFAEIDQEIAMHLRDLCIADTQSPAAGSVDELPRFPARRIFEGRAAGAASHRLRRFPRFSDLVHFGRDHSGIATRRAKKRLRENIIIGDRAMPI